eukprot:scaffold338249_cov27-Prasinocladus_malaysianus.AAC.1
MDSQSSTDGCTGTNDVQFAAASGRNVHRITGTWQPHEDDLLQKAVLAGGQSSSWSDIARHVPGRSGKSCRLRWTNQLSPSINKVYAVFYVQYTTCCIPVRVVDSVRGSLGSIGRSTHSAGHFAHSLSDIPIRDKSSLDIDSVSTV